ncbi:GNAT family N-acetyltransferase [Thermoactinospora rubra]|uniref:GNAT family N-acetyltransferase n=1 Tax=Thermoactinospora rubra TaxID=1088767 RepID=UPI000A10494C|nr:GNAT family N-acetyltransferase [Thermoactinospora rubra]
MLIRRLAPDDLDACVGLAIDRGWTPERRKWRLLFDIGEVYGVVADDGLAATNVLTRYGDDAGVISMVLTASRHARQGLGRRLMDHVLERAGDRVLWLHATRYGRPLYEKVGFRVAGQVDCTFGEFAGAPSGLSRPATPPDLDGIAELDAEVFGVDRSAVLARMFDFHEQVRVIEDGVRDASRNALMVRGGDLPGDRSRLFLPTMVALG